jgi:hypothetical protein
MSSNICGNCQNFKPRKGDKFFTCNTAKHAGVKYIMQVRSNTRSCDAFLPFETPSTPKTKPEPKPKPLLASKPTPHPQPKAITEPKPEFKPKARQKPPQAPSAEDRPRPTGLCIWGRVILITSLVLVIGLPAWGIYSCVSKPTSVPVSTPVPMPSNAVVKYFDIGETILATAAGGNITISSAEKKTSYGSPFGDTVNTPPGKLFVFITVTCKNIGNTSFLTGPSHFLLTDSAGNSYQDQTNGDYSFSKPYPNASLSPSITVSGNILWIVPVSASGMEVSYLLDSGSNPPVIARWKLPQ